MEVNEENINKLIEAAGIEVESYWPKLFASMIQARGIPKLFGDGMLIQNNAAKYSQYAKKTKKQSYPCTIIAKNYLHWTIL